MKNDKQLDYLKAVLLGQLTIEAIEDLQGTNKYIDELVMIDAVIDKYKDNQEWFMEHESADFLKLD